MCEYLPVRGIMSKSCGLILTNFWRGILLVIRNVPTADPSACRRRSAELFLDPWINGGFLVDENLWTGTDADPVA